MKNHRVKLLPLNTRIPIYLIYLISPQSKKRYGTLDLLNACILQCVVPENIHTPPPPRKGFAVWPPLPSGFSKIGPQNLPPLPSGISKIFAHPLEILLSLIEGNKEVVLFPRMPNFVSFVYFLLNCITDKRIPYD